MKLQENILRDIILNPTSLYDAMTEEEFNYIKAQLVPEFPQLLNIKYDNKGGLLELLARAMKKDAGDLKKKLDRELMIRSLTNAYRKSIMFDATDPSGDRRIREKILGDRAKKHPPRTLAMVATLILYCLIIAGLSYIFFPENILGVWLLYVISGGLVWFNRKWIVKVLTMHFLSILRKGR